MPPVLSIMMPVYNGARYLRPAVESLLHQTFTDFELIVVDDGSTDNSMEIVASFSDPRIRILRNGDNRGIVYSRNRALAEARGRYLASFDADDIAHPRKFERQIRFLEEHPDFGMVGCRVYHIDAVGARLKSRWRLGAGAAMIPALQLFRAYFIQSAVVYRREALPEGGYAEGFDIGEDYRMYYDVSQRYRAMNLPEYLLYYRIHDESIQHRRPDMLEACETKLYQYIYTPLQIDITHERFRVLQHLKHRKPMGLQQYHETGAFLRLILRQNRIHRIYPQKILWKVVLNRRVKALYKLLLSFFLPLDDKAHQD
ncbi:MAG TPA: glycosyltransferase family 2 protein [Bacteroidales bacterium]|nr:glycosyltransferase family 2 protein [Bacteroidales bacterium]HRZ48706.1 glycosyltransferase family 2 protein [Bacteroidales bacterium]